jgi:hypothetical protein
VDAAGRRVRALLRAVLAEGVEAGTVRDDIATDELAAYCVSALNAAAEFPSKAAVSRLVAVTVAGLRP